MERREPLARRAWIRFANQDTNLSLASVPRAANLSSRDWGEGVLALRITFSISRREDGPTKRVCLFVGVITQFNSFRNGREHMILNIF